MVTMSSDLKPKCNRWLERPKLIALDPCNMDGDCAVAESGSQALQRDYIYEVHAVGM